MEKALKRGNHTRAGLGYIDKNDTNELLIKTDLKKQIEVMAESNKAFQKQVKFTIFHWNSSDNLFIEVFCTFRTETGSPYTSSNSQSSKYFR